MSLFNEAATEVLLKFLDKKAKDAEEEIASKGILSEEHAIPLILKSQFNHIMHLDTELTELRKSVHRIGTGLVVGFTILGFLIILFQLLK